MVVGKICQPVVDMLMLTGTGSILDGKRPDGVTLLHY